LQTELFLWRSQHCQGTEGFYWFIMVLCRTAVKDYTVWSQYIPVAYSSANQSWATYSESSAVKTYLKTLTIRYVLCSIPSLESYGGKVFWISASDVISVVDVSGCSVADMRTSTDASSLLTAFSVNYSTKYPYPGTSLTCNYFFLMCS